MASRPMTRAQIIDAANNIWGTTLTTTWTDTKANQLLDDVITEVSNYVPYVMRDVYQIESRTGTATSTSSGYLVDTKAQFVSAAADAGKVVYNVTDRTWAVITSFTSTSQVGISKDIFTVGEQYEIYNAGCWSKRQININNSDDLLWVVGVSYPVDRSGYGREVPRNFNIVKLDEFNNILEIDVLGIDDSNLTNADKDVYVYTAKQHKLNTMVDLAGQTKGTVAADATSMTVEAITDTDTPIYKDTLFRVALASGINSRNVYRVTADATISGSETAAAMAFYPAMEAALGDHSVVTFLGSTLTPELEGIVVQLLAGEALIAEGVSKINAFARGGSDASTKYYQIGTMITDKTKKQLKALVDVDLRSTAVYSRS